MLYTRVNQIKDTKMRHRIIEKLIVLRKQLWVEFKVDFSGQYLEELKAQ